MQRPGRSTVTSFPTPEWAGVVLAMQGNFYVFQMTRPMGVVNIRYQHDMSRGFWSAICEPEVVDKTLEIQLSGPLVEWDGKQRPTWVQREVTGQSPLALPTQGWVE